MKANHKNITPQPLPGQRLPDDWRSFTADYGGTYDRRDLQNMWKQLENKTAPVESLIRNARLTPFPKEELFGRK